MVLVFKGSCFRLVYVSVHVNDRYSWSPCIIYAFAYFPVSNFIEKMRVKPLTILCNKQKKVCWKDWEMRICSAGMAMCNPIYRYCKFHLWPLFIGMTDYIRWSWNKNYYVKFIHALVKKPCKSQKQVNVLFLSQQHIKLNAVALPNQKICTSKFELKYRNWVIPLCKSFAKLYFEGGILVLQCQWKCNV